ncbi:hypothetical protein Cs7R123_12290 [Catellatospora sp. TT07R-123]|nr:hypothetical protein Cs7R123_12290 [Catellatospora sp. TT07R-123]
MLLASAAAGAVLLAGCAAPWNRGAQPEPAPVSTEDATATSEALALLRLGNNFVETRFRTDLDVGGLVTTVAWTDNPRRRFEATLKASGRVIELRGVGDAVFLKPGGAVPGVADGWYRLDPARVPRNFAIDFTPGHNDPGGSDRLIDAIVSAQVSGRVISGTIDLAKIGVGIGISIPTPDGGFPERAHHQLFDATLDDRGYLIRFELPISDSADAVLQYGDFGTPVDVEAPPGAPSAPEALYALLGSPGA